MPIDFLTLHEIVKAARANLNQGVWDYLVGGAESETSLKRNRLAYDRLALATARSWKYRPAVLDGALVKYRLIVQFQAQLRH